MCRNDSLGSSKPLAIISQHLDYRKPLLHISFNVSTYLPPGGPWVVAVNKLNCLVEHTTLVKRFYSTSRPIVIVRLKCYCPRNAPQQNFIL